jgi:Sap, sulfolipid-1-addressing protein
MGRLLAIVLPLALGAAMSPTLLGVQLVTLSRRVQPLQRAWAVAAGAAFVLAGYAAFAVLLARSTGGPHSPSEAGAIVKLVAAVLLVVLGIRALRETPTPAKPEHTAPHPEGRAFAIGAGLMLTNFSSIVLFLPAMHAIGVAKVGLADQVIAFALLYAITLLPVYGPPLVVRLMGPSAKQALDHLNRFFVEHRRAISAAVCFCFAALLTFAGLKVLL